MAFLHFSYLYFTMLLGLLHYIFGSSLFSCFYYLEFIDGTHALGIDILV